VGEPCAPKEGAGVGGWRRCVGATAIGDRALLGRKLTGAMAARKDDAAVTCSQCAQCVPISDALACCFRAREIQFPKGTVGGLCALWKCNLRGLLQR
jgi:hypothetical protein